MGYQIIKQPDGLLAVFSSNTDTFIVVDATPDELIEWRAEQAAESAREEARMQIERVLSGESRPYYQFTLTWEQAVEKDREHGGELLDDPEPSP